VRIAADTNVLLRAVLDDDPAQNQVALEALESAELIAISVQSLCEFVWVLERAYKVAPPDIAVAIRRLIDVGTVSVNRPAVDAGLRVLESGGDFADGVIAHEGNWLGGDTFVSFDKRAVSILAGQGHQTRLLTARR